MKAEALVMLLGVVTACTNGAASVGATATLGGTNTTGAPEDGTDDSGGTTGETEAVGACVLEVEPVGPQEPALADLQAPAVGTYSGMLRWRDGEGLDVQYLGDTAPSSLTVELTALAGAGRRVQSDPSDVCPALPVLDPARCPCPDALEFDASVRVSTADGVLDETLETTVRTLDDGNVVFTAFELEVAIEAAGGSLEPADFQSSGDAGGLLLAMRFDLVGPGATRALLTVVQRTDDGSLVQTIGDAAAVRSPTECGMLEDDATACELEVCTACACEGVCP